MQFDPLDFPNLHSGNHHVTSLKDDQYNCVAWAAGCNDEWWDPVLPDPLDRKLFFWPAHVPRDSKVTSLIMVYEWAGFARCAGGAQEAGIEKIAIYAKGDILLAWTRKK